ncbi:hypothetical protein PULV_a2467 [Pseudoalteromonas ulvae UL12]|uniref:hypothetical protein n=1 Tax=Pseudoalteromonas ulvae TaxID=107327 RepID=UPI00186B6D65|nr:hypothetical protein [Pseudoalteromonas ulvae]MBE0364714.1 hypothetical protein [Pseudoalteromonas ulvae UL12]
MQNSQQVIQTKTRKVMTSVNINAQSQGISQVTKSNSKRAKLILKLNSYGRKLALANAVKYK